MCVNFTNYWNFLQCKNILWNQKCVKFSQTNTIFDSKTLYTPEDIISVQNKQGANQGDDIFPPRPKHYMDKRSGHYYFFSGKSHFRGYQVRLLISCDYNEQQPKTLVLASWGHLTWHVINTFIWWDIVYCFGLVCLLGFVSCASLLNSDLETRPSSFSLNELFEPRLSNLFGRRLKIDIFYNPCTLVSDAA